MACGLKLVGVLLIIFNVLLFLIGLALIAVGLWSVIDKIYVADVIGDDMFSAASYIIIVAGVILLTISILGIITVRKEKRLYVIVYFVLLLVIFIVLLLAAILAVVLKSELEEKMVNEMRSTLASGYGADSTITSAWDKLQSDLECCGVRATVGIDTGSGDLTVARQESWLLYLRTEWYQNARRQEIDPVELVPKSCCVNDPLIGGYVDLERCQTWKLGPPGNLKNLFKNDALLYDGCYEKARQFVADQADILVGCAFAFGFFMIGGLVLTLMLFKALGQHTRVMKD